MYMWISSCQRYEFPNSALQGSTPTTSPPRSSKPPGLFIQALTEITVNDPVNPVITIGIPLNRCSAGRQPPPPVRVDADEDRLHEEREPLDREAQPEDAPERRHELRPQEAHLEAQHRPGDHPDREQRHHHSRPTAGERQVERIARPQPQPLDEQ